MPYSYPGNIPDAIKKLPKHAGEIWVAAYNAAHKQYDGDEAKANATAMAAVKTKYEKVKDKWRVKKMSERIFRFVDVIDKNELQFNEDGTATSEVQFFARGEWQHQQYGKIVFDENKGKQAVKNYQDTEKELNIDYNHLGLDGDPDAAIASGWLVDGLKETGQLGENKGKEGLWGIVKWTKKAAEYIKNGEYKYISPEFTDEGKDKKTGKKIGFTLLAAALTNRPFLEGMAPVALSERALAEIENVSLDEILGDINAWLAKAAPPLKGKKGSPDIRLYLGGVKEKLRELIKKSKTKTLAEESLDDRRDKVSSAYRKRFVAPYNYSGISHWVQEVFDTYVIAEKENKFLKVPYTVKDDEVAFGDPVEVEQVYQEKKTLSTEGGEEMDRKLLCAQLGLSETATDEAIAVEIKRLIERPSYKALAEGLGLNEKATELEVLEAVKKLKEAGSQTAAEGIVKLADFQRLETEHTKTKKLAEELKVDRDALSKKLLEKDRDEVIGKALTELKILPKAKEVWEGRFLADPENTRKLIDTLAPVLELKEHGSDGSGPTGSTGEQIEIKCTEKMVANKELSYSDALLAVQTENPVEAKEYAKECRA